MDTELNIVIVYLILTVMGILPIFMRKVIDKPYRTKCGGRKVIRMQLYGLLVFFMLVSYASTFLPNLVGVVTSDFEGIENVLPDFYAIVALALATIVNLGMFVLIATRAVTLYVMTSDKVEIKETDVV